MLRDQILVHHNVITNLVAPIAAPRRAAAAVRIARRRLGVGQRRDEHGVRAAEGVGDLVDAAHALEVDVAGHRAALPPPRRRHRAVGGGRRNAAIVGGDVDVQPARAPRGRRVRDIPSK